MQKLIYILGLFLVVTACNNNSTATSTSTTAETPLTPPKGETLPSITMEIMQNLFDNCDYIDYVFYTTNFSISQNEKASIQTALSHVSQQAATLNPNCKAIGRIFYQIEGKNVMEADLYFQEGCTYFVFVENNKPIYGNNMTDEGVGYLNNIFARAQGAGQAQGQ